MTLTALKLVYDRKTKSYRLEVVESAGVCLAQMQVGGLFCQSLKRAKRQAVMAHLEERVARQLGQTDPKLCPIYGQSWGA